MTTTHALTIEPDQKQLLEELAASQLRSPEILVREAINQYLAQQQTAEEHDDVWDSYDGPRLSRKEFLVQGLAAKRDLDETGLHLTNAEITNWTERLQTDPSAKLPECHT